MITDQTDRSQPTPLLDMPEIARMCSVGRVLLKAENQRQLGNFKSLGGGHAVARALARAATDSSRSGDPVFPRLICASDGNHGLAVAVAARAAGANATVYLPATVSSARVERIAAAGAKVVRIEGTYDDAVDQAALAAGAGEGLLIADTSDELDDPVVTDVMEGYQTIAREVRDQLRRDRLPGPSHLFVQAGVGGLAAAMAVGLEESLTGPRRIVVVEPAAAACVVAGLAAGHPVRIEGSLHTCAEMLSCGVASAPALAVLLRCHAASILLSEGQLLAAPNELRRAGGPDTTPSGAAGLGGLIAVASDPLRRAELELTEQSVVILFATESA